MIAYIPWNLFSGASLTDKVYLYSMFGAKPDVILNPTAPKKNQITLSYIHDAGFEEWALGKSDGTRPPPPDQNVPDGGATLALLGLGLAGLSFGRRLLKKA
jgi:hypothetical protein